MKISAVIVGIDDYQLADLQLTSAVNDAYALRDVLLETGIADERNMQLLTTRAGDTPPTFAAIEDALYRVYAGQDTCDRFLFYFSGHGLLVPLDVGGSRHQTVIVPVDLDDWGRAGRKLISVDEVVASLRQTGPEEQFYFIDACRELRSEGNPAVATLGWAGAPISHERRQAVLWAVSPLGTAIAPVHGMGIMTEHLVDAIRGKGIAADIDEQGRRLVTIQSIRNYVVDAVAPRIQSQPLWERVYRIPQLEDPTPRTEALRPDLPVIDAELTVHIDPDEAAARSKVAVALRGVPLQGCSWPPRRNHEAVALPPQIYVIEASSTFGTADPTRAEVDLRKQKEARIRVISDGHAPRPEAPRGGSDGALPATLVERAATPADQVRPDQGRLSTSAIEAQVRIEIEARQAPPFHISGRGELVVDVPPGPYQVRFRLGPDVFSETDVYVQPDRVYEIGPRVQATPLVYEALTPDEPTPSEAVISETLGPLQAGVLPTMLAAIGIKPFDVNNEVFHQFNGLVPPRSPSEFDDRPLSLVVAADHHGWPMPPALVAAQTRWRVVQPGREQAEQVSWRLLAPLMRTRVQHWEPAGQPGTGLERVSVAIDRAPLGSYMIELQVPYFGRVAFAAAAIQGRLTVATVTLRPGGGLRITQSLLRFPGTRYPDEDRPNLPYAEVVRTLQLGQVLYEGNELAQHQPWRSTEPPDRSDLWRDMIDAKWVDPVLSCMAYLAWRRQTARVGTPPLSYMPSFDTVMDNHLRFFSDLPDSLVMRGLHYPHETDALFGELLVKNTVPILAESTRALAAWAVEHQMTDLPVVDVARRTPADEVWSLNFESA